MAIILNLLDLNPPKRVKVIQELTEREFNIPYSRKKRVSRATIYQWLKEYRRAPDPAEALLSKPHNPNLNLLENVWDEVKEKWFTN